MATPDSGNSATTLEQAIAQMSSADPQTFYRQAQLFEQAADKLHDVQGSLSKYRRDLAEAWNSGNTQRQNRLDRLVRHVEGIVNGVQNPGYPRLLRQIGDTIADTKQRLAELKDGKTNAKDDKARSDIDKRAAKLMEELSTSYSQLGGQLTELPGRTDTTPRTTSDTGTRVGEGSGPASGTGAPAVGAKPGTFAKFAVGNAPMAGTAAGPFVKGKTAGTPMAGGSASAFGTRTGGSMKQLGSASAGMAQPVLDGAAPPPVGSTAFGRFSQFAGCPSHGGGWTPGGKAKQIGGLAGGASLFSQPDGGKPSVLGKATGGAKLDSVKLSKNDDNKKAATNGGHSNRYQMPDVAAPSQLESHHTAAATAAIPMMVSTAGPQAGGAPAAQQATAAAVAGLPAGGPKGGGPGGGGLNGRGPTGGGWNGGGPNSGGMSANGMSGGGMSANGMSGGGMFPDSMDGFGQGSGGNGLGQGPGGATPVGTTPTSVTPAGSTPGGSAPGVTPGAPQSPAASLAQAPAQASAHLPAPAPLHFSGTAGTVGAVPPPSPPAPQAQNPIAASIPTQMRPPVALGAEHLQLAAAAPGGSGMPLGAFSAQANFAQSTLGSGSGLHSGSSALPAGPHGVLGASPRSDAVWLRADSGSWSSLPVAAARLGRDDSAGTGGVWWRTERHEDEDEDEDGKEGR